MLPKYKIRQVIIRERYLIWQSNSSLQIRNGAPFRQQLSGLLQACDCENSISTSWPFITGAKCNLDNAHISPHERLTAGERIYQQQSADIWRLLSSCYKNVVCWLLQSWVCVENVKASAFLLCDLFFNVCFCLCKSADVCCTLKGLFSHCWQKTGLQLKIQHKTCNVFFICYTTAYM